MPKIRRSAERAPRRIMIISKDLVNCERLGNGAFRCTAFIGDRWLHCDYYGYSKVEASRRFRSNPPVDSFSN